MLSVGPQPHVGSTEVPDTDNLVDDEPVDNPNGINDHGAIWYTAAIHYPCMCMMKHARFARIIYDKAYCLKDSNNAICRTIALDSP